MRLIEASGQPIESVAVSADGRWIAATDGVGLAVWEWATGRCVWRTVFPRPGQVAFSPDGTWLAACAGGKLHFFSPDGSRPPVQPPISPDARFAGGLGFSPDGRHFFAGRLVSTRNAERLERWFVPTMQLVEGFNFIPGFPKLAFSADGQYIGGISEGRYELRIAVTGGLNARLVMPFPSGASFTAFSPDSKTAVAGWDAELHVIETVSGKRLRSFLTGSPLRDIAFTGSGHHLATVDEGGVLKLWEPGAWRVAREYDWGVGPLTCVACTADGLAGVCGTESGRVLMFDVDE